MTCPKLTAASGAISPLGTIDAAANDAAVLATACQWGVKRV